MSTELQYPNTVLFPHPHTGYKIKLVFPISGSVKKLNRNVVQCSQGNWIQLLIPPSPHYLTRLQQKSRPRSRSLLVPCIVLLTTYTRHHKSNSADESRGQNNREKIKIQINTTWERLTQNRRKAVWFPFIRVDGAERGKALTRNGNGERTKVIHTRLHERHKHLQWPFKQMATAQEPDPICGFISVFLVVALYDIPTLRLVLKMSHFSQITSIYKLNRPRPWKLAPRRR